MDARAAALQSAQAAHDPSYLLLRILNLALEADAEDAGVPIETLLDAALAPASADPLQPAFYVDQQDAGAWRQCLDGRAGATHFGFQLGGFAGGSSSGAGRRLLSDKQAAQAGGPHGDFSRTRVLGITRNHLIGGALLHQTRRAGAVGSSECSSSRYDHLVASCAAGPAAATAASASGGIGIDPAFNPLSETWYDRSLR